MRNVRHDGVWDIEQEEMMTEFFAGVDAIRYEGPDSPNPLAFHYYDPDRVVLDKTMKEHLRAAVCYWHSFQWPGSDVFGAGTFDRPWLNAAMEARLPVLVLSRPRYRTGRRHVLRDSSQPRSDG